MSKDDFLSRWGLQILSVPDELKENCLWAVSTMTVLDQKTGRKDKSPRNPYTGQRLSVTDPTGWVTYEEALNSKYPAMGILLTENDPYVVIDLDKSENKDANEFAKKIHDSFNSYAELSASGNGIHIILRGRNELGRRKDNVEIYSQQRYIICTGRVIRKSDITEGGETLAKLREKLQPSDNPDTLPAMQNIEESETDSQVLLRMFSAKNGETVKTLYSTVPSSTADWSNLDSQLAQHICFYTKNHEQALRLFKGSTLWRGEGSKQKKSGYENDIKYVEDYLLRRTFNRAWHLTHVRDEQMKENAKKVDTLIRNSLAAKGSTDIVSTIKMETDFGEAEGKIIVVPGTGEIIRVKEPTKIKRRLDHFPVDFPEGLVGDIAKYFYGMADRPFKEAAVAGAISFVSAIAGRHYNVNGSGLGLYTVLLGQTGVGKNVASQGVDSLFSHVSKRSSNVLLFKGPSSIASGQGLIRTLCDEGYEGNIPSKLLVLGEFGHMLKIITARDAGQADVKTRQVLLDMYSKNSWGSIVGESTYSDSTKNTKSIYSPNLALLGDTTPISFFESVSLKMIGEGFLPRFFVIEYEGSRPNQNESVNRHPSEDLVERCASLTEHVLNMRSADQHMIINYTDEGKSILDNFNDYCDYEIRKPQGSSIEQAVAQIWNRAHLNALRLAGILAVGKSPYNTVIDEADATWAVNMVTRSVQSVLLRLVGGDFGSGHSVQLAKAKEVVYNYYNTNIGQTKLDEVVTRFGKDHTVRSPWGIFVKHNILPYTYIHDTLMKEPAFDSSSSGSSQEINSVLGTMVKKGYLREIDSRTLSGYNRSMIRTDQTLYGPGNMFDNLGFEVNGYVPVQEENSNGNA